MLLKEYDSETAIENIKGTKKIEKEIKKMEMEVLFAGKYDQNNAIITLHPGAGEQSHKIGLKCYIGCT